MYTPEQLTTWAERYYPDNPTEVADSVTDILADEDPNDPTYVDDPRSDPRAPVVMPLTLILAETIDA